MANSWRNNGSGDRLYILGLQNHCRWWLQPQNKKMFAPWKKNYDQPRQHIKKQTLLCQQSPYSQRYGFSSCHVWIWELDYTESWAPKIWCPWTVVLGKTLADRRSNQSVLRKSVLNIHWKNWCWNSNTLATWCEELTHWKRPWCWVRLKKGGEGTTEDEMVGWHHRLNGHEIE